MKGSHETDELSSDTLSVARKVLERSPAPLTAKRISEQLPRPFKVKPAVLTRGLEREGPSAGVFSWPGSRGGKRFWVKDPEAVAGAETARILSNKALTLAELDRALGRSLFGCTKTAAEALRKKVLPGLVSEKKVFQYPLAPRQKARRFSALPPDPAPYLGKVLKEYQAVRKKLEEAGVSDQAVLEALVRELTGKAGPSREAPAGEIQAEAPEEDLGDNVISKALEMEPAAAQEAMVSLRRLRDAVGAPKESFDRAVLKLARQGRVWLHRHVDPAQMNDSERAAAVPDGKGGFFIGIVLRDGKWETRSGKP